MSLFPQLLAWFLRIAAGPPPPDLPSRQATLQKGATIPIILKWNGLFHPLYDSEGKTNLSTRNTRV
jgi:hypothetical protein